MKHLIQAIFVFLVLFVTKTSIAQIITFNLGQASQFTYNGTTYATTNSSIFSFPYSYAALIAVNPNSPDPEGDAESNYETFYKVSRFIDYNYTTLMTMFPSTPIVITIPSGSFFCKAQGNSINTSLTTIQSALGFVKSSNITIQGESSNNLSKIIYYGDQYYGGFTLNMVPTFPYSTNPNIQTIASLGTFILFTNGTNDEIKNITIKDLEIDGNIANMEIGSPVNMHNNTVSSYQLNATGIQIQGNVENVTIENVNIHHMALDGIQVTHVQAQASAPHNINIKDSKFEYNGRQGLSWTSGNGLLVTDCEFNHTGQVVINTKRFADPPSCGIDIEPNKNNFSHNCENGTFGSILCKNNYGYALDINTTTKEVKNITLSEVCEFIANDENKKCVNFNASNLTIVTDCYFRGANRIVTGYIDFNSCEFTDGTYNNPSNSFAAEYLIYAPTKNNVKFESCIFSTEKTNSKWFDISSSASLNNVEDYITFKNCDFKNGIGGTGGYNYLNRILFDGTNTFSNLNTSGNRELIVNNLIFKGSNDACQPNSTTIGSKIWFRQNSLVSNSCPNTNTPTYFTHLGYNQQPSSTSYLKLVNNGYLYFTGNCSNTPCDSKILFEKHAVIENYGTLIFGYSPSVTSNLCKSEIDMTLGGKILSQSLSTIDFNSSTLTSGANSRLFVHPTCSLNYGPNFLSIGPGFKMDGGHSSTIIPATSINEGILFNGINEYVQVTTSNGFWNTLPDNFSIEVNFKWNANTPQNQVLFSKRIGTNGLEIGVLGSTGRIYFKANNGINYVNHVLVPGNCYNLMFRRYKSGSNFNYNALINGNPYNWLGYSTYNLVNNSNMNNIADIIFGKTFNGIVSKVRTWDSYLSPTQLCEIDYNEANMTNSPSGFWNFREDVVTQNVVNNVFGQPNGQFDSDGNLNTIEYPNRITQNALQNCIFPEGNSFKSNPQEELWNSATSELSLYPNPNNGQFSLMIPSEFGLNLDIQILDLTGQLIYSKKYLNDTSLNNNVSIEHQNLASGIYLLRLSDGLKTSLIKFIRQ